MSRFDITWNAVLPALGLALILGVALLPALAVAAAVTATIYAIPGGRPRLGDHVAPRRALRSQ